MNRLGWLLDCVRSTDIARCFRSLNLAIWWDLLVVKDTLTMTRVVYVWRTISLGSSGKGEICQ
jgi:hypothetical protein